MAKTHHIQRSLNAGELSPLMEARSDQNKYMAGCRTCENFIPLIYGGVQRRPGTEYIADAKSASAKSRLAAFEASVDDTYILELSNQSLRVFKDGAQLFRPVGSEDLSDFDSATGDSSLVAHWLLNDNLATQAVLDDAIAGNHDGTTSTNNTEDLSVANFEGTANKAFDLNDTNHIDVGDHANLSFGDGSVDTPFSISAWIYYESDGADQYIISKWDDPGNAEWSLSVNSSDKIDFIIHDDSAAKNQNIQTNDTISEDTWYHIAATYDGRGGGSAVFGMKIYINAALKAVSISADASYVAMEALGADLEIGTIDNSSTQDWVGRLDNIALFNKELSITEVSEIMTGGDSTVVFEITTPYLTADLFALKFEQSADVMWITHPSYETRRLSRFGDTSWVLRVLGLSTGPFRDQNTDTAQTIAVAEIAGGGIATGASVTLTASGHSPFVAGTTAGHLPSGPVSSSKSQTGALYKLVYSLGTPFVSGLLDPTGANSTATLQVNKGVSWDLVTNGTWGQAADSATIILERTYDNEVTYETVTSFTSAANFNIDTSGTEENGDALYRLTVSETTAGGAACAFNLSVRDSSHTGIVEITAVANPQSATAAVRVSLGLATDTAVAATHRWSEGSFSNLRGWPIDVTISSEERLTFAGNISEPLTTWGSVIGDFENFRAGTDADDAIIFTLIGSGQQNRIRWMLSQDDLVLGTIGGEHLLGASKDSEALTPTNARARLQTTYGSENIAAKIVNQAVLFVQRGGKKIREFLYNFEADSRKADDLTVFSNHITGDGILDMTFQRTPDPTLWCIRSDGEIAIMNYERDQNIFSWSRIVTKSGDEFESAAIIYGGTNSEDEVWVSVKRTINGSTVRYIERFYDRNLPDDLDDLKFIDSGITCNSTPATTTITGLDTLEGAQVSVLADGVVVSGKTVTISTIGHWKLNDDAASTTVVDSSSNANDGGLDVNTSTISTAGKINDALDFSANSGDHWVDISDQAYYSFGDGTDDSPFSVALWAYIPETPTGNIVIISKWGGSPDREWSIFVDTSRRVKIDLYDDTAAVSSSLRTSAISTGWHHIVATYNGLGGATAADGLTIYIDGQEETSYSARTSNASYVAMDNLAANLEIASSVGGGSSYEEKLDDIRLYDVEINAAQVTTLYNSGSGTEAGGNTIELDTAASTVQVGLPYTSTVKPMRLNTAETDLVTTKRINKAIVDVFETIGGEIGPDTSHLEDIPTGTSALFSGFKEISIPGGYGREGDIIVRQTQPLPMTVRSINLDLGASRD